MDIEAKIKARRGFLQNCAAETQEIHTPILDLRETDGFLNPAGLGNAQEFSNAMLGQSTIAFDRQEDFEAASQTGKSVYGSSEYGVVRTKEADELCQKFTKLHNGAGAVALPSGLAAIATVFLSFLTKPSPVILIPENAYFPTKRTLKAMGIEAVIYNSDANAAHIESHLKDIESQGKTLSLLYLEAPGSLTYEIPELDEIIALARNKNILTAMDNTWASHVRYRPLDHGVDLAIQATTKYEGGYGDTPSGIVIAADENHAKTLAQTTRTYGIGAVSPPTLRRLSARVDSTAQRLEQHYQSAQTIMAWLEKQPFIKQIICPAHPDSADHQRFLKYFKKGNSLLSFMPKDDLSPAHIKNNLDKLLLFRTGASWGGHVSLVQATTIRRQNSNSLSGYIVRMNVGLENAEDLITDLDQAFSA